MPSAFPALPDSGLYSARPTNGYGTPDSAALWRTVQARSGWIEENKRRAGGWCAGTATSPLVDAAGTYDYGTAMLPPVGNGTGDVEVWLIITVQSGAATVSYYAQPVTMVREDTDEGPRWREIRGEASKIADVTASGNYSATLRLPVVQNDDTLLRHTLRVYAVNASGSPDHVLETVAVIAPQETALASPESGTVSTTWPALKLSRITDDTPDDVYTARRMRDQQAHVVARYPRVLMQHSFADTSLGSVFGIRTLKYLIPRGPQDGGVTLWLYGQATAGSTNQTLGVSVTIDPAGSGGTTPIGAGVTITATAGWFTISDLTTGWAANALNEVWISVSNVVQGDLTYSSGFVSACSMVEDEYAAGDFVLSGDSTPAAYAVQTFGPTRPIVGDYAANATERNGDRLRLAENAVFQGLRRSQAYVMDRTLAGTASSVAEDVLYAWRAKHRTSYGTERLAVWACVQRDGADELGSRFIRLRLYSGGVATSAVATPEYAGPTPEWVYVGSVTVTEATEYELDLRAGFVDQYGDSAAASSDGLLVVGGLLVEQ